MKEHRGKAIYTTLLTHRMPDAHDHGARAAVIQAVKSTSAPICRRLGFTEICNLEFYTWSPVSYAIARSSYLTTCPPS